MDRLRLLPLLLLLSAAAAPVAQAAPTSLYLHFLGFQEFPINTQEPADTWTSIAGFSGPAGNTLTCLDVTGSNALGLGTPYHTQRGYSNPGLVDYNDMQNGEPRMMPVRGLVRDAPLDATAPAVLHWILGSNAEAAPAPGPSIVVRAALRGGDDVSVDNQVYDAGPLLAGGESRPATLAGPLALGPDGQPAPDVTPLGQVGGRWLYDVAVPLQLDASVLAAVEGFNLRVDTFVQFPGCDPSGQGAVMLNDLAPMSVPGHRPRLELGVLPTLGVEGFVVTLMPEGLWVALAGPSSAFGYFDFDNVTVTVVGPDGPLDLARHWTSMSTYGACGHDCGHQTRMDLLASVAGPLPPGHYDITASFTDTQGTQSWSQTQGLDVAPEQESPAGSMPVLALVLVGVVLLARRR